jgi:Immunoglobulin-like domain of bacterial spore germination/Sporulation and spore germination
VLLRESVGMKRAAALLAALALTGCGASSSGDTASRTTTAAPPPTTTPATMTVTLYRVRNGAPRATTVRTPASRAVAAAALRALGFDAPVTIAGGTARVDLDRASDDEITAIVYTLTEFPSVQRVDVAGRTGLTRADVGAVPAPIVVDAPGAGASVSSPFRVTGSASVFEATLVVRAMRGGRVVEKQTVTASEGAPGTGTFEATVHASPGPLQLQVFSPSAVDGSPQHEVDVDVTVTP